MPFYSVPETSRDALISGRHFGMNVCYLRAATRSSRPTGPPAGATRRWVARTMLDLTVYGRQESWEDSPEGWPRLYLGTRSEQMRTDEHGRSVGRPGGRPISQWPAWPPATPTTLLNQAHLQRDRPLEKYQSTTSAHRRSRRRRYPSRLRHECDHLGQPRSGHELFSFTFMDSVTFLPRTHPEPTAPVDPGNHLRSSRRGAPPFSDQRHS